MLSHLTYTWSDLIWLHSEEHDEELSADALEVALLPSLSEV